MNREEYLRELDEAGEELGARAREFAAAANPLNQIRGEVARDWKWWLPGASVAGFAAARLLRMSSRGKRHSPGPRPAAAGAAFWIPLLLKLLPAAMAQLVPLFLSLRSGRKN
jgi:hypothetical protein